MRAVVFVVVFLSGCGLVLDFDPPDPIARDGGDTGMDGGTGRDGGHPPRDLGTDFGTAEIDAAAPDLGTDDGVMSIEAGSGEAGASDAGSVCSFVPSLDHRCSSDMDCAFAIHQTDCCGSTTAIGINLSELAHFLSLEPACVASYPMCSCPAGATITDSGEMTTDRSTIRTACVARGPDTVCLTYITTLP